MNLVEMLIFGAACELLRSSPEAMRLRLSGRKVVETGYALTPCDRAPAGWWCSRKFGHAGPCAAKRIQN